MVESLNEKDIAKELQKKLTKQDYSPKPIIAGVEIVKLPYFSDEGGSFVGVGQFIRDRFKNWPNFSIKQINFSQLLPGVVKAAHLHLKQEDIWFVPPSCRLLVGLMDGRQKSKTKGMVMRFTLGGGKSELLYIPRGVAHGMANLWSQPASILYFVNNAFDPSPAKSDEYRLPPDIFGKDFWQLSKE